MTSTEKTIQIRNLTKRYAGNAVVDRVSLDVADGEFVTLLGLSGSGKSTTLMTVAGFVDPDEGAIIISGRDVTALEPEKRNLGVVFQNYALFPHLNVFDNIAFPLKMRGVAKAKIETEVGRVLDLVSLQGYGQRRISQLSGGQQQRIALARALVFAPRVLLMDEPLGALDRQLREQLQTEIRRIHRQLGVTILYVTHDQEEALSMSDRIAIMAHGRIQQVGTPSEIYLSPSNRFVAGFFGESNFLDVSLERSDGSNVILRPKTAPGIALRAAHRQQSGGTPASVMVRPEAIAIDTASDATFDNNLAGTVEHIDFLGATTRIVVRTEAGPMTVRTGRLDAVTRIAPGSEVWLKWQATETMAYPADTQEAAPENPAAEPQSAG
ncbi:ABC transporter ATP-binding protein [Undibacter mobilis]|uniref:Spermidine/putrescine import ATP-binding protein PotA n=2 Tax=Undibacter mobilis TaxID=2292256 RepID=A0A371B470_9BRAD|nr:ABC transporter ATP-binding protein [Undibacter mobilis]